MKNLHFPKFFNSRPHNHLPLPDTPRRTPFSDQTRSFPLFMEGEQNPRAHRKATMHTKTHHIPPAPAVLRPTAPIRTGTPSKILTPDSCLLTSVFKEQTQFHTRKSPLTVCRTTTYIAPCYSSPERTNPFSHPHLALLAPPRLPHLLRPDPSGSASLRAKICQDSRTLTSPTNCGSIYPAPTKPASNYLNERTQFLNHKIHLILCLPITYIIRLPRAPEQTNPILKTPPQRAPTSEPNPIQTHTGPIPNPIRTHPRPAALRTSCPSSHVTPFFPVQNRSKSAQKLQKTAQNPFKTAKNCSKTLQNASKMPLK